MVDHRTDTLYPGAILFNRTLHAKSNLIIIGTQHTGFPLKIQTPHLSTSSNDITETSQYKCGSRKFAPYSEVKLGRNILFSRRMHFITCSFEAEVKGNAFVKCFNTFANRADPDQEALVRAA